MFNIYIEDTGQRQWPGLLAFAVKFQQILHPATLLFVDIVDFE